MVPAGPGGSHSGRQQLSAPSPSTGRFCRPVDRRSDQVTLLLRTLELTGSESLSPSGQTRPLDCPFPRQCFSDRIFLSPTQLQLHCPFCSPYPCLAPSLRSSLPLRLAFCPTEARLTTCSLFQVCALLHLTRMSFPATPSSALTLLHCPPSDILYSHVSACHVSPTPLGMKAPENRATSVHSCTPNTWTGASPGGDAQHVLCGMNEQTGCAFPSSHCFFPGHHQEETSGR